jgi:hypothetical protein
MTRCVEGAAHGQRWIWGAPTYDQVRVAWEETRRAASTVAEFRKSDMTVAFPSGGRILYRSLDDPDNARGWSADGVAIDEAADVAEAAWYEVLRPMLMDTGGESWVCGTPKGQNWFWRECVQAQDRPDARFWNAPTLGVSITERGLVRAPHPLENPSIPFAEIVQLFRTLPERIFRQEVLSEFIEESGGVFRKVREAVDAGRTENEPPAGSGYVMGVDLARVEDFTVLTVLAPTGRQVYHERFNQISWERQIATVERVAKQYGARVLLDSTGVGDPIFEALRDRRLDVQGFTFTNQAKRELIDALALALEAGGLRLMDVPAQTSELLAYRYELTPARNVKMAAPAGMHDDCVIGLALAWWARSNADPELDFF